MFGGMSSASKDATCRTLVTSKALGWRSAQVEHHVLAPASKPAKCLPDTYLGLLIGPGCELDWRVGGRPQRARLSSSELWVMPAATDAAMAWRERHETIRCSLSTALIGRVADELGAPQQGISPSIRRRDPRIAEALCALSAEAAHPGAASHLLADALAVEIAVRLLRCVPEPRKGTEPGLTRAALSRTLDFIEAHLGGSLDLCVLANVAGVSVWHFARQFRVSTGLPPHAYATARRVERAKVLLQRADASIIDVASAVGFASPSHFAKVFARATGKGPAAWRRCAC